MLCWQHVVLFGRVVVAHVVRRRCFLNLLVFCLSDCFLKLQGVELSLSPYFVVLHFVQVDQKCKKKRKKKGKILKSSMQFVVLM